MDKFKKIDKEYLITDSTVNCYGYRLMTNGYLMDEFKRNPIGYYLHGTDEFPREQGVVVKWEDFRREGDKVYAKPCVNLSHPRGQRTVDEIENGFLNAASVGKIVALEISNNPDEYLEGQNGPTISKWFNRELSVVDIPGNYNALADLVDSNELPINLADFKPQFSKMKQLFLSPANLTLLNLKADAEQGAIDTALADLVAKAGQTAQLQTQVNTITAERDKAVKDLADFSKQANVTRVKDLLDKALNVDKKITKEIREKLEKNYEGKPDELKDLIDAMPAYQSVTENLKGGEGEKNAELEKMTWAELDKKGKLPDLKASNFDSFKAKYKAKFGKEYKDDK